MSDLERRDGHDVAVAMVGGAFAVFLAEGTGSMAPAVIAMATPLTTRMVQLVATEWCRKMDVIADSALRASRLDPEDFCDALAGDAKMIALTQKILFAASVTGNDRKLGALGALLGKAVGRQGKQLDETNLLIDALTDLEDPHVAVMDVIAASPPDGRPGWLASQVQAEVEMQPDLVLATLSMLTRHGLADTDNNNYGSVPQFLLTDLGRALADVMKRAAHEPGRS